MALFEVELASQWLRHQLQKNISVHFKFLSVCRFFSLFVDNEDQSKYISYYIQFKDDIVSLIKDFQFNYCTPEEIDELKNIVDKVYTVFPTADIHEKEKIHSALDSAKGKILRFLNEEPLRQSENGCSENYSINQVLIENDPNSKLNAGIIEKLRITTSKNELPGYKDKISFENNFEDRDNSIAGMMEKVVALSRKEAEEKIKNIGCYNFNFYFEQREFIYTGTSMGLGVAVLTFNSILRAQLYKLYYKFRNDVVLGCAIDTNGFLVPLEDDVLKLKLKTVFYSSYKKFVIPEQNIIEARKYLEELNSKYSNRKLELIPIKHYMNLFKNLDIVEICKLKLKEKLKAHYNQYHVITNSALTLLILVVLIILEIKVIIPEMDRNPVYTEMKNNRFVALNKFGKNVWMSDVLSRQDMDTFNNSSIIAKRFILTDIDNDGRNDILLLINKGNDVMAKRTVYCFNADGSTKWKTVFPDKDSLYGNDYCSNDITTSFMYLLDNNKKKNIFVVYRVCVLYPTYIAKLNSQGKINSEFYNSGAIDQIVGCNFIDSSKEELICGGINNDLNKSGVLIVFDPDYVAGCSPGYRYPKNYSKGLMKYYLLFPKTDVGKFSNVGINEVDLIEIHGDRIVAYVSEMDTFIDKDNQVQRQRYVTIYTLDKLFNVLHVETSSEFDARYQQLVYEGKLKPVKNWKKYKEKLASQVRWWDGDKFVNHPVMNKYYLERTCLSARQVRGN